MRLTGMDSTRPNRTKTPWDDDWVKFALILFPLLALVSAGIGYASYVEGCTSPYGCAPWWIVLQGVLVFEGTLLAIPIVVYLWRRRQLRRKMGPSNAR